jgi:muramoyltetrapeptide carboxypeptidase
VNSDRLRRPDPVEAGDTVTVVAPSGPVDPDRLRLGCKVLEGLGLTVRVAAHVLDRTRSYLAGSDEDRAADFTEAWLDPNVAAVLCARGGYGAIRMVDLVDWPSLAVAPPKLFAGSSDVTALHEAIAVRLGVATLFGPMVATTAFADLTDGWTQRMYARVVRAPWSGLTVYADEPAALCRGTALGITVGGNLSLLAATVGSSTSRPGAGGIVLLEDITEEPYRIDRLLTQLLRSGWFDGVAGVALGTWTECGEPAEVDHVLWSRLAPLGVPILGGLPFGHGDRQASIPLGVEAVLDADAGTLTVG